MSKQYQNYQHSLAYTYAFGHFAAEAALLSRPHLARELLIHSELPPNWVARLSLAAETHGVPLRIADSDVERVRKKATVQAVLVLSKEDDALEQGTHVLLAGISQYGNLGTIMRTMVAFGFTNLALVASSLDAWNPHALRASVGLRGHVRAASYATLQEYQATHPEQHYVQLHTQYASELVDFTLPSEQSTIVFGPEWPSNTELAQALADLPGDRVRIEQSNVAESLNLAAAAAIVLHHWRGL